MTAVTAYPASAIRVQVSDPAGKRPMWEHAAAMRLLLAQAARPMAGKP